MARSPVLPLSSGVLLLLLVVVGPISVRFVVENNSLMVTSPNGLRGKHDSAIGNFRIPQYGGSMAGTVVYPKKNANGCDAFDESVSFRAKPGALPNFVLIDRGEMKTDIDANWSILKKHLKANQKRIGDPYQCRMVKQSEKLKHGFEDKDYEDSRIHFKEAMIFLIKDFYVRRFFAYRGKLEKKAVLKAICAGFEETTEPAACLSDDIQTIECLTDNGGCWQDKASNITACKDTFRGRVCECPLFNGVQFKGDGYSHCEAIGPGRCRINNGGCWHGSLAGKTFSACQETGDNKCQCPYGFKGDGIKSCEDIDECKEKTACQCPECSCKNAWGGYECTCSGDFLYIKEHDTCINKRASEAKATWAAVWAILIALAIAGIGAYTVYKYRLRSYMDSEIRAIMAQYMPLDSQNEVPCHAHEEENMSRA